MKKVIKKATAKKYQDGGSANAKKVAANKKKVEANRKKVEANREKVILGKYSPNSHATIKDGFMGTDAKGNIIYKVKYSASGPTVKRTDYEAYDKPRTTESNWKTGLTKATSMDTTGYAAGKKTFVKNEKVKVGPGNMYKQTSKKVERKDVPKELKKMQTMKKAGGTIDDPKSATPQPKVYSSKKEFRKDLKNAKMNARVAAAQSGQSKDWAGKAATAAGAGSAILGLVEGAKRLFQKNPSQKNGGYMKKGGVVKKATAKKVMVKSKKK